MIDTLEPALVPMVRQIGPPRQPGAKETFGADPSSSPMETCLGFLDAHDKAVAARRLKPKPPPPPPLKLLPGNRSYQKAQRAELERLRRKAISRVYFIQCGEFVKIGRAADPRKRLSALKTGKWFRFEGELRSWVQECPASLREQARTVRNPCGLFPARTAPPQPRRRAAEPGQRLAELLAGGAEGHRLDRNRWRPATAGRARTLRHRGEREARERVENKVPGFFPSSPGQFEPCCGHCRAGLAASRVAAEAGLWIGILRVKKARPHY